jgi:LPS-assembly lipoprotein
MTLAFPRLLRGAALLLLLSALPACTLRPLYSGGAKGAAAQMLGSIEVQPMSGKAGWLMRDALQQRLGAVRQNDVRYRLEIELDDQISGFGLRRDDSVTRERRTLRARYRLIDLATGTMLLDATAGSDAGIDVVSSEYATIAAENTALENLSGIVAEQIVARLAQQARSAPAP